MAAQQGLIGQVLGRLSGKSEPSVTLDESGLRQWLVERLARYLKVDPSTIETSKTFEDYGLDSRVATNVASELEKLVERRLSPALLYEHNSIDRLAAHLAEQVRTSEDVEAEPGEV